MSYHTQLMPWSTKGKNGQMQITVLFYYANVSLKKNCN